MEKEKQSFEAALEELENIVYGTELENYVGAVRSSYNDIEQEIAALRAEQGEYKNAEIQWEKLMMELLGEDGLKSVRKKIENLKTENYLMREAVSVLSDFVKTNSHGRTEDITGCDCMGCRGRRVLQALKDGE